ncbi:MAG TPA: ATP-binding cassette domain-containing protein [Chloroflexota bacterium]|nr:ATP-binding cassette domain-containing protein [Chloroflexota bacterium]
MASFDNTSAVTAEGLGKRYPNGVVGLRDVSATIQSAEVVGLLGRSGSGKTTLFRLLVGALRPTSGRLTVLGTDMSACRGSALRDLRRRVAWVSQQHNLVPGLSTAHNVLLGQIGRQPLWRVLLRLMMLPERDRRAAFEVLNDLGIADKLYDRADDLSGGQQQRVAVARAILGRPRLVLADEPVASVDARTAEDVLAAILRLNAEHGATVILSLHQPEVALRLCPRILVLERGSIVYDGAPDGIDRRRLYELADDTDAEEELSA